MSWIKPQTQVKGEGFPQATEDVGRFEDIRRMWRNLDCRKRLQDHWLDARHPQRNEFLLHRQILETALSYYGSKEELSNFLEGLNFSLDYVVSRTPCIHQAFFPSDGSLETMESQMSVVKGEKALGEGRHSGSSGIDAEVEVMRHHLGHGHRKW